MTARGPQASGPGVGTTLAEISGEDVGTSVGVASAVVSNAGVPGVVHPRKMTIVAARLQSHFMVHVLQCRGRQWRDAPRSRRCYPTRTETRSSLSASISVRECHSRSGG